jgi:mRNA-degrading endonuclease RelE of RelBE toxin-antitoxin system
MRVDLARQAQRDLHKLRRSPDLKRLQVAIESLRSQGLHADVKALEGARPWLRLRTGDWRIIYRKYSQAEVDERGEDGYVVARIVNRRDLADAVRSL